MYILNRCLGIWLTKHLEEITFGVLHCCIVIFLNYVNTTQFSGAYISLYSSFYYFLVWHMVNLIFYKLFIGFDILPICAVCIMDVVGLAVFQA